ncbi:MAG: hypothetical protein JST93_02910 [Acidobacteria bacterium]|nr:hypothetical protein [Acidobacteriota bacterium]
MSSSVVAASPVPTPAALFSMNHEVTRSLLRVFADQFPLTAALERLRDYHILNGYVRGEQHLLKPQPLQDAPDGQQLHAVYNPLRRERHNGTWPADPPPGFHSIRGGCFLAPPNILWQQRGRQIPYPRRWAGRDYNFLLQPFPFAPMHFTVATDEFCPQDWRHDAASLHHIVRAMRAIAASLDDGFSVLYNGKGAGSSIDWLHYHVLLTGTLPIQEAARHGAQWPIPFHRVAGTEESMAAALLALTSEWQQCLGTRATECIAMVREHGQPVCYYFPRDRTREYAARQRFAGRVGAYESCGVFILSKTTRAAPCNKGAFVSNTCGRFLLMSARH